MGIFYIFLKQHDAALAPNHYLQIAVKASVLGCVLLSLIYIGFSYLASFHGFDLKTLSSDQLLAAITLKIAGPYAGWLVCVTIALACLTTSIALMTAFVDFVQKEVFKEKLAYEQVLVGALRITFLISTLEFTGISAFLGPILTIAYPGLILLTVLNIAYRLKGVQTVKLPVFIAFVLCSLYYAWF